MNFRRLTLAAIGAAVGLTGLTAAMPASAQDKKGSGEVFVPLLVYRTGPYAPNGIPTANAMNDYFNLVNERDGGINGVKITWEECETAYNNDRGVECYERLKNGGEKGATIINPYSTGITYALIERAAADKIPLMTLGYGRTDAADGRVFPYSFPMVATYWSQATAMIKYIAEQEGGMDKLKGKKIALVYHDSAYGKEPIPTLETLADQYGFKFSTFPVAHPGLEQKSTWLKIGRQLRPDWVLMWGWGVMNPTAIKEAAAVNFPREKFIGVWWSGAEPDVVPVGDAAKGYKAATFNATGTDFPIYDDLEKYVYSKGLGKVGEGEKGAVLYNRGLVNAMLVAESLRKAMEKYGNQSLNGEQAQYGMEHLKLTDADLERLGFAGMIEPITITCMDHEGGGKLKIQQWDGEKWNMITDWIEPMRDLVRKKIEASAAQYAKEKGITPRECPAS